MACTPPGAYAVLSLRCKKYATELYREEVWDTLHEWSLSPMAAQAPGIGLPYPEMEVEIRRQFLVPIGAGL